MYITADAFEMEAWDGYLADGSPAGKDLIRGKSIPKGLRHLLVSKP